MQAIINGTIKACNIAGASWGGGESPTMRDIIKTGKSLLSGSAMGIINPSKKALSEEKIKIGDRIDRKSTRLNSSHQIISYAVFCLKKKKSLKYSLHSILTSNSQKL